MRAGPRAPAAHRRGGVVADIRQSLRTRRNTRGRLGAVVGLLLLAATAIGTSVVLRDGASADVADDLDWSGYALPSLNPAGSGSTAPAFATDDDPATIATSALRAGTEPYLLLDLESVTHIRTVRVTSSSTGLTLLTGDERGIPGSTVAQATGQPGVTVTALGAPAAGVTVPLDLGVRYVRVQGPAGTRLSVSEIELRTDPAHVYVADPGDLPVDPGEPVDIEPTGYGPAGLTWQVRGLPAGFAVDPTSGRLTGATTTTGRWTASLTATDTGGSGRTHTAKFVLVVSGGPSPGVPSEHPAVDVARISNRPTASWGVIGANASTRISGGNPSDSTPSLDVTVWDLQQIDEWMYVGGEFNRVIAPDEVTTQPQAYLARFRVADGVWDSSWRPVLNGNVHALEVDDRGRLLVGGEFTSVNGAPGTAGFAVIDPATGGVDPTTTVRVERRNTTDRAIVRELEVVGGTVYLGGAFSHVGDGVTATRVYNAARLTTSTGAVDPTWIPRVMGGSVWGIGVDAAADLVHLSGWFSSVEGAVGTARIATVDRVSGALATTVPMARNSTQIDVYDVEAAGGALFAAGSEHVLVRMQPLTRAILSWETSGYGNPWTYPAQWAGNGLGGDFQFVEKIGDWLFAGCHCNRRQPNAHWSSATQRFSDHIVIQAYRVGDGSLFEPWNPDIGGGVDGTFSVATDDRGCVWAGGDIVDGGFYEPGGRVFARGFARFCAVPPPAAPTDVVAIPGNGDVALSWTASSSPGTVTDYVIRYRATGTSTWRTVADGVSDVTSAVVQGLDNGRTYEFRIAGVTAGGTGAQSPATTATPADLPAAVAADAPVAHWRFGEQSGTTAASTTGPATAAELTSVTLGEPGALAGSADTAFGFDGAAAVAVAADAPALRRSEGTVTAWVRTTAPGAGTRIIVAKPGAWDLHLDDGTLAVRDYSTGAVRDSGRNIADGRWHHIAVTFRSGVTDGTVVHLDGQPVLTTTIAVADQTRPLHIGSGPDGVGRFSGSIDEVSVHAAVLTPQRIAAHHRAGSTAPGVPGFLRAESGSGYVVLTWEAPSSPNPIADYTIQVRPSGSTTWSTVADPVSPAATASVDGLTNGTGYEFRVAVAGTGAWSTSTTAVPVDHRTAVLADGPVGYWRLGEASGTTATNAIPAGAIGTYTRATLGAPGGIADSTDTAASFSGATSGAVMTTNPTSLQLTEGTIEAWVRTTNPGTDYRGIVVKQQAYGLFVRNGNLVTHSWGGTAGVRDTGIPIADGRWHHVAMTFRSGVTNGTVVYLDGRPVLTTTITVAGQTQRLVIGAGSTGLAQSLNGTIDEVAVYPTVLSPQRIAAHHRAGIALPDVTPPSAPTDLTAQVLDATVTLSWTAATDDRAVTGYVLREDGSDVATVLAPTTATTVAVPPGT
ncbi:MAG: fibronectin type III domain-containing protein, partial [Acidimicrobiales bacterium]|nr:fibronectin type III domain-containing protein [Acidimicrobiales bacterium]